MEEFLRHWEPLCVNLCELFIERGLELIEKNAFLIGKDRHGICAIVGSDLKGHILPMITGTFEPSEQTSLSAYFRGLAKIVSVLGTATSVNAVMPHISLKLFRRIEYVLMCAETPPSALPASSLSFEQVKARDIPRVFPLQEGYEKEEVLLDPAYYNKGVSLLLFGQKVKKYPHYMGMYDRRVVSMARINAKGWNVSQIGGVYTLPGFRNRGFAKETVACLMNAIHANGRYPALFVKVQNSPALALYKALGFSVRSGFSIAYFS